MKLEKDMTRQKELTAVGVNFIRFRDSDVRNNLDSVVALIKDEIHRLSACGGSPPPLRREEKNPPPLDRLGSPPLRKEE